MEQTGCSPGSWSDWRSFMRFLIAAERLAPRKVAWKAVATRGRRREGVKARSRGRRLSGDRTEWSAGWAELAATRGADEQRLLRSGDVALAVVLRASVRHADSNSVRGVGRGGCKEPPASQFAQRTEVICLPGPPRRAGAPARATALSDWQFSLVLARQCAGEAAGINHQSVLQTGTTDPGRGHRVGVTRDEAENAPRLRV
jgi:hypothetical protein